MTVSMQDRLRAHRAGAPMAFPPMERVETCVEGVPVVFHLNMARDPIQNCHRQGRFYETAELDVLKGLLPQGAVVLDVGANVGNHALWLATHGAASKVVVVEPNPLALEPLVANVLSNKLDSVIDLNHLGFGLADRSEGGFMMKKHDRNLGATKMFAGQGGDLTVRRGDDVFHDLMPDFVKIDVEGMEIQVLAGLENLIARARPVMMVEVDEKNVSPFVEWMETHAYDEYSATSVGDMVANHIIVPQRS